MSVFDPIPGDIEVLTDAIEEQSGERPDELCPAFLSCLGMELGGHAREVALVVIDTHVGKLEWVSGDLDPDAIWRGLVKRRSKLDPFTGLLRAEVWSACWWQAQSLKQLQELGLCDAPAVELWEWCRTLHETRQKDVFEVRWNGEYSWRMPDAEDIRYLRVPVRSKIRADLVVRPQKGRLAPQLKAQGWRIGGNNLLRDKSWTTHSRKKRQEAIDDANAFAGPPAPKWPHKWVRSTDPDITGLERCGRCGAARWLRPGTSTVYRYATGTEDEIRRAYEWGGRRSTMPLCKREEGS